MLEIATKKTQLNQLYDRRAIINFSSLQQNFATIKKICKQEKILAYVKANAYGHGLINIVEKLVSLQVNAVAVSSITEFIAVKKHFRNLQVVLGSTFYNKDIIKLVAQYSGDIVIYNSDHIDLISEYASGYKITVWLKVNTGMNRMGISPDNFEYHLNKVLKLHSVKNVIIMSHLSSAYDINTSATYKQIELLQRLSAKYDLPVSLANSAAILKNTINNFDWVRPGILLYGVSPLLTLTNLQGFSKVMTLMSRVININYCKKGDRVGYGGTWVASCDSVIAVVAIGYADGYPYNIKEGTPVLINNKLYPIVGRVSMDVITVDITLASAAINMGDDVMLWGNELAIEDIAKYANTIPYQLLTSVSPFRVNFETIDA
jgi:alanine racemase